MVLIIKQGRQTGRTDQGRFKQRIGRGAWKEMNSGSDESSCGRYREASKMLQFAELHIEAGQAHHPTDQENES